MGVRAPPRLFAEEEEGQGGGWRPLQTTMKRKREERNKIGKKKRDEQEKISKKKGEKKVKRGKINK